MSYPKIIDNDRRIFLDVLKDITPKYSELSIATGFWDLLGTGLIIEELKKYKKVRLLIGREPLIPRHMLQTPEPDYPDQDFFDGLEELLPEEKLKKTIIDLKELISKGTLEVRVYRKAFLHAKCYIFGTFKSPEAIGIIGSSNFTKNGLTKNTELNALESDHRIVTYKPQSEKQEVGHLYWFDKFWDGAEKWEGRFCQILEESPTGDMLFSPYEMYIKTLYELYKEELESVELKPHDADSGYDLFDFQKQNAQHLLRKLKKYKTAMLADSVGLGKTITAIEVIREYAYSPEGRKRIEIICPKALKEQWEKELNKSKVFNITPIVLQNPQSIQCKKDLDSIASVSLFVIDESHNLRKTGGKRYQDIVDWIRQNKNAHVLLLTATPINNELTDLVNQFLLGTGGKSDVITVQGREPSMQNNFVQIMNDLQKNIKQKAAKNEAIDYVYIRKVIAPIIRSLVVRRTRLGIKKEFGGLLIDGKKKDFPETVPDKKEYKFPKDTAKKVFGVKSEKLDLKQIYLYDPDDITEKCTDLKHPLDQLDKIQPAKTDDKIKDESPIFFVYQLILMLGLIPYRWRMYRTKYYGKTVQQIKELKLESDESRKLQQQRGIYGIFRTIFLKRMESSSEALEKSLTLYKEKLNTFKKAVNNNQIIGMKEIKDINEYFYKLTGNIDEDPEEYDEELEQKLPDELILDTIDDAKYNTKALKGDIERDIALVDVLLEQVKYIKDNDTKVSALVELLKQLDKEKPDGGKVLVFTYYADTLYYLKEKLLAVSDGLITESNSGFLATKNRFDAESLACRFSPKSKLDPGKSTSIGELRFLFSTDILSEGQNLQDCGVIINYDLHWNPVRMIQRNGRINRIGTEHSSVYIYNMKPEMRLDSYLKLVKRLEDKIAVIKYTIGTDQTVLGEEANPIEYIDTIVEIYGDDATKRKQAFENLDSAGDFLLAEDSFVYDLKEFDRENSEEYKEKIYKWIPKGKWGLMPIKENTDLPHAMALSRLYSKEIELSPEFISVEKNGDIKSVNTLQSLQYLRTTPDNNKRTKDSITGKHSTIKKSEDIQSYALVLTEPEPLRGSKKEVLNILYGLSYEANTIDIVKDSFYTKNHLLEKDLSKLAKVIVKAKKDNKPYNELLKQLIETSRKTIEEKTELIEPDKVEPVLYYSKDNK